MLQFFVLFISAIQTSLLFFYGQTDSSNYPAWVSFTAVCLLVHYVVKGMIGIFTTALTVYLTLRGGYSVCNKPSELRYGLLACC